ncbi:MAG: hypothetical protein ACR2JF_01270 [Iamia sp.]
MTAVPEQPRVVVASMDALSGEVFDDLLHLVRFLTTRPLTVEVVLIGDGDRLRDLRREASVTVVDALRRRGPGRIAVAVGRNDLATRIKSHRLRRWVSTRADATWVVHHPRAASILRFAPHPPPVLVASAHGARAFDEARAVDLESLADADLWLATTPAHRDQVANRTGRPALAVGDLTTAADVATLPRPGATPGPVTLLPPAGTWSAITHTVEVARLLAARCPQVTLSWIARSPEDRWLARHDIARLGLDDRVTLPPPEEWSRVRPSLVVRTGYAPGESEVAFAAAFAGVPVIGFDLSDLPDHGVEPLPPFAVEGLVDQAAALLDDPETAAAQGDRLRLATRDRLDLAHRLAPLLALLEGS